MERKIIEEAIKNTDSMLSAAVFSGLSRYKFHKLAKKYGLWKPNQSGKGISKRKNFGKYPLNEILAGKYPQYKTGHLKRRLIEEGLKENRCEKCGIKEWNNKKIVCQLDHINGIPTDHRLENLRILCPNCHSQTDTFCGKNK